jgi:thymidylate synthase
MYVLDSYDEALENILKNGVRKKNRTGVDTLAIFGILSRYKIEDRFPILTRRKVWPKAIFAELLWFISGSTNNKDLQALGSNIWTNWVDEEFERKHGYEEGSLGPVYGFQLRHFGGKYNKGLQNEGYGYRGFDQLAWMIEQLKVNPSSRRILFSLWNPHQIDIMRLAPCHYTYQVFVNEGKLSGMLTQRSCDFPVGVPANIQFYSALTYMLAQQVGLEPYEFIHSTADSHIYENQIKAVEEYLSRPKPDSPKLNLKRAASIYEYELDSFELVDYNPEDKIKVPVEV